MAKGFRPLSWGLFFNKQLDVIMAMLEKVFVPFLGDFFSMRTPICEWWIFSPRFRPLSWGLFFNLNGNYSFGDTLFCFRPLSWGLFFNLNTAGDVVKKNSFRPLSWGLFFNFCVDLNNAMGRTVGFRPLSWGLFFNSVPAKPQPVCSRKRIRGGDGGIASSGTLLRR